MDGNVEPDVSIDVKGLPSIDGYHVELDDELDERELDVAGQRCSITTRKRIGTYQRKRNCIRKRKRTLETQRRRKEENGRREEEN